MEGFIFFLNDFNDVYQLACQNLLFKALALGISGIAWHLKLEQMSLLHPDLYIT